MREKRLMKDKKIEFTIEGNDYEKLNAFKKKHKSCLDKHPNMTCGHYSYSFSVDGLGVLKTVTCVCGKSVYLDGDYNLGVDDEFKLPKNRFQVIPEDRKTKEVIRTLLAMQKRPGMYFGSTERRSYSALSMFLAGYGCGARAIGEEEIYWGTMDSEVRREFIKMTEGKDFSDQEQFDIFFEALDLILRRDYPQYLEELSFK